MKPNAPVRGVVRPGSRRLRVAMVSSFLPGLGGGTGRYVPKLAHLLASECEVLLIRPGDSTGFVAAEGSGLSEIPAPGGSTARTADHDAESPPASLRYFTVAASGEDDVQHILLDRPTFGRYLAALDYFRPNIVHAHETTPIAMVAQYWALLNRVPCAVTFHVFPGRELEFGFADKLRVPSLPVLRQVLLGYIRRFYRNCEIGFMWHDEVRRRLDPNASPARLFMIPQPIDLSRFERCQIADLGSNARNLCYIGFLSSRKNQQYLLEVMRHLPSNYRLWLIGRTLTPSYEQKLREYAIEHGLTGVEFLGELSDADLLDRLERTHAFVSASRLEVQASVINEALASGTPVVALDNQTANLIDERVGSCLPADAPAAVFARRVQEICAMSQVDYEKMCREVRARVNGMDWAATIKATIAAYESVVSQKTNHLSPHADLQRIPFSLRFMMAVSSGMYALSRRSATGAQDRARRSSPSPAS